MPTRDRSRVGRRHRSTTPLNLSMLANARRINPNLFLAARQNRPASAALFEAMKDAPWCRPRSSRTRSSCPSQHLLLWRFIQGIPRQGDRLVGRGRSDCSSIAEELPALRTVTLNDRQAPALHAWLAQDGSPSATCYAIRKAGAAAACGAVVAPFGAVRRSHPGQRSGAEPDDQLLFAGAGSERRELEGTMIVDATAIYVLLGERVPAGLVWRKLTGKSMDRMS